ncbi:hypothetical protein H4582DRAFT_1933657 [Lactarius indigo]|nr:hypothetical protein H4582DRAFT_1933657 [Lactarius indigo]
MVASGVDPKVEAEIAEMTRVALPPGSQHRHMKEGDTPKEVPVESPGVELSGAVESIPGDCLKKNVATSVVQTGGMRKLEVAPPKAATFPLAKAAFAENHAVRAMGGQEAEENASTETMRLLEAEAAKERADAEERAREVQEEAIRARESAYAEAKKAAVEARKTEAKAKYEAEFGAKVETATNANEFKVLKATEAKAAAAKAELGAKQTVENERLEIEAKSRTEVVKAEVEEERKRIEAAKAELRVKQAAEQTARQRAADRAARAAAAASGTIAPARVSGGGSWFSKIAAASVATSAIIPTEGPTPPPTSTSLWNSDPWSKRHARNAPSPRTELDPLRCPGGPGIPIQNLSTTSFIPSGSAPTHPAASITEALSAAQDVGVRPDGALAEPVLGSSQHGEAGDWGPAVTMGGDANPEGPMKPLRLDYIREVGTAPTMAVSSPGMPTGEVASPLPDQDGGFNASGTKLSKREKKELRERARKQQQQKGEKNSPHPPSGEASNSVDNSAVQEFKPVTTAPPDTFSYRGGRMCPCGCEGESGEDDVPVIGEKPDAVATPAEMVFGDASDGDGRSW